MGWWKRGRAAIVGAVVFCVAVPARANPEPPGLYDARVTGMGGQAVAFIDNAAAIFHNPAGLDGIDRIGATVAVNNLLVNLRAPFSGPGSEQDSGLQYAPFMFIGGGYRIHPRLVLGIGAYIATGYGGGYDDVARIGTGDPETDFMPEEPVDEQVFLVVGELAIPLSVRINERLQLGLAVRLPYGRLEVSSHQEILPRLYRNAKQSVQGFGRVPGVLIGFQAEPVDGFLLGAVYRSKIRIDMDGTTKVNILGGGRPSVLDTSTEWYVPHMVRLGAAWRGLDDRLLLSAEFRLQFHDEANNDQTFDVKGFDDITAPFDWKNVMLYSVGAEYFAHEKVPLRLGFSLGNAATPSSTLTPFTPPPGWQWAISGGFGVWAGPYRFDLGFSWGSGRPHTVAQNSSEGCQPGVRVKYGCAGTYSVDSYFLGVSATFQP